MLFDLLLCMVVFLHVDLMFTGVDLVIVHAWCSASLVELFFVSCIGSGMQPTVFLYVY